MTHSKDLTTLCLSRSNDPFAYKPPSSCRGQHMSLVHVAVQSKKNQIYIFNIWEYPRVPRTMGVLCWLSDCGNVTAHALCNVNSVVVSLV